MRNVIFAINIALDGCCDHTKVIGNEEILEHYTHLMRDVDLLVYGRKPIVAGEGKRLLEGSRFCKRIADPEWFFALDFKQDDSANA